jgi:ankyrin repeat protein
VAFEEVGHHYLISLLIIQLWAITGCNINATTPDERKETALHIAAAAGDADIVAALLDKGVCVRHPTRLLSIGLHDDPTSAYSIYEVVPPGLPVLFYVSVIESFCQSAP